MDNRSLKHFINLAETLHFGRASEAGNVSPSALSRAIARIEDEVGVTLFERNNRSVELTRAGKLFLAYARETLGEWDTIRNRLMEEADQLRGEVSMYCSVTASYSFLFEILTRFRQDYPNVEIKLHTGDPEDAISRVLSGSEDISIGARPGRLPAGLAFKPVAVSPLVFIAAKAADPERDEPEQDEPLKATSAAWSNTPLILPERGLARRRVDDWFRKRGISPRVYAQVAGNEAIVSMVSLGFGVGVVPQIVLENSPLAANVRALEVEPRLKAYEVGLFTLEKKLGSPIIKAFWDKLQ
jgi:LysR family positive regulator for ilvC